LVLPLMFVALVVVSAVSVRPARGIRRESSSRQVMVTGSCGRCLGAQSGRCCGTLGV